MSSYVKCLAFMTSITFSVISCSNDKSKVDFFNLNNSTMGTEYNIVLETNIQFKNKIQISVDSLLNVIEDATSVYRNDSYISTFNQNYVERKFARDEHFLAVYEKALDVFTWSNGSYDASVMPIVRYIGFANNKENERQKLDTVFLDSLSKCVGFDKIDIKTDKDSIYVNKKRCSELDFGAIAKGYAVDAVVEMLETKNIKNYLVEIGGETRCLGVNHNGERWKVGIDLPEANQTNRKFRFAAIYSGSKSSIATSGNYRNFYIKDGKKFVHTVDPKKGRSVISDILSVTILHDNCALADGLATACMVMGSVDCIKMIDKLPNAEAFIILSKNDSTYSYKFSENGSEGIQVLN